MEFFMWISLVASIGSPLGILYLCAVIKQGFIAHTGTMQAIFEEVGRANRTVHPPVQAPHAASESN